MTAVRKYFKNNGLRFFHHCCPDYRHHPGLAQKCMESVFIVQIEVVVRVAESGTFSQGVRTPIPMSMPGRACQAWTAARSKINHPLKLANPRPGHVAAAEGKGLP
jgi:hypothetical protein